MARDLQQNPIPRPSHEEIARRAYEIFIERGRPEGRDLEHWLEAEGQLCAASAARTNSTQQIQERGTAGARSQSAERSQSRTRR